MKTLRRRHVETVTARHWRTVLDEFYATLSRLHTRKFQSMNNTC